MINPFRFKEFFFNQNIIAMKKICFIFLLSLFLTDLFAQKETFDIINYVPPAGWIKEGTQNVISYTITNKKNSSWCRIGIIKSTNSKGSIEADFESEWQDLIVSNYSPTEAPQLTEITESDGWKIKAGVTKFVFNQSGAIAMLTTISGYNLCASIVATTNNQEYLKDVQTLLTSVDFNKPVTTSQPSESTTNSDNSSILGTWGISASDQSSFRVNNGVMNYIIRQYTFNADGIYSFVSKAFDPLMDKILLGKETGTYQINGSNLTISPGKSVLEEWSKKNGRDDWGELKSTQNITLEKVTYQFAKQYFSGVREWSLVLQNDNQTHRDGSFSSSSLKNSWIYSPPCSQCFIKLPEGQ